VQDLVPVSFTGPWGSYSSWKERRTRLGWGYPRRLVAAADGDVGNRRPGHRKWRETGLVSVPSSEASWRGRRGRETHRRRRIGGELTQRHCSPRWGIVEMQPACGVLARKELPESKEEGARSHLACRWGG
jgi:hypothetical protein